ncbi:hypothetical protein BDM02DRAFT_3188351 [Thelephora ganbajun]|uniref:Uncharacterized protein n=1 Tax=Thelephora ganbajun TaxID=370292 RepID=A0ACB6ZCA2_THEGA|nr:hypothetical protein BDM02DRAFT_3188351 [Thelephora ganbajun]
MTINLDLSGTLGAAFIGMVAATLLFGVSNLQTYIYYMQYPHDWIVYKVSVAVLWVLDAFNLVLTIHAMYHYLVLHFYNIDALIHVVWSFKLQTVMNVPIIVMVQALYALRLWKLNYRRDWVPRLMPLTVLIAAGELSGFSMWYPVTEVVPLVKVIGTILAVRTCQLKLFTELPSMAWITYASFGSAVAVDSILAAAIVYYLRCSRGEFESTNNRIAKLVFWTLSTGIITRYNNLSRVKRPKEHPRRRNGHLNQPHSIQPFKRANLAFITTSKIIVDFTLPCVCQVRISDAIDTHDSYDAGERFGGFGELHQVTIRRTGSLNLPLPTQVFLDRYTSYCRSHSR